MGDVAEVELKEKTMEGEKEKGVVATEEKLVKAAPGLFGISYASWASVVAFLFLLWVFVALFFWLLINVAVKMRSNDYKVLPYEFIGSEFAHGCSDRNWGKAPCPMKSYSSRNVFPWIDYACNTQIHGFNNAYSNLCVEMTAAFGQYYLSSTV